MKSLDTKQLILQRGAEIVHKKGFNHTGIQEILTAAGVPKGSFYFYFKSKEDFGLQLIDFHEKCFSAMMDEYLQDRKLTPVDRLRRFFSAVLTQLETLQYAGGCPLGNLAQEMSDQSEAFRLRLQDVMHKVKQKIVDCLKEAQQQRQIKIDADIKEYADFIFNSWQGALMMTKVVKDAKALTTFDRLIFEELMQTDA